MLDQKVSTDLLLNLGNNVKQIRLGKNLSQVELARHCEMEKSTLSKIEKGKVNISFLTIYRLAKCLNVPLSEITG